MMQTFITEIKCFFEVFIVCDLLVLITYFYFDLNFENGRYARQQSGAA
jgi:hypothetical protein